MVENLRLGKGGWMKFQVSESRIDNPSKEFANVRKNQRVRTSRSKLFKRGGGGREREKKLRRIIRTTTHVITKRRSSLVIEGGHSLEPFHSQSSVSPEWCS